MGYTPKFIIILCLIFRYLQTKPCMGEAGEAMYGSWFCQGKEKSSFPWCLFLLVALAVLFLAVAVSLSSPDMQLRPVPKDRWGEGDFQESTPCMWAASNHSPVVAVHLMLYPFFASVFFLCSSLLAPVANASVFNYGGWLTNFGRSQPSTPWKQTWKDEFPSSNWVPVGGEDSSSALTFPPNPATWYWLTGRSCAASGRPLGSWTSDFHQNWRIASAWASALGHRHQLPVIRRS